MWFLMDNSNFLKNQERNLILFVGKLYPHMIDAVREFAKEHQRTFRIGFLYDSKIKLTKKMIEMVQNASAIADVVIVCDTNSLTNIQEALLPYQNSLLAISCRGEDQIPMFSRIIPHVPYLKTPTSESLAWSSDKLLMRRRLRIHNKKIAPLYTIVSDGTQKTIQKIIERIGFPLMIKPSGLAASRLVTLCFHKEELEKTLQTVFRKLKRVHKETGGTWEPRVLAEQFIEGDMYSVDAYVTSRGKIHFCPFVEIKTGKQVGFDDFFGYRQMTPTKLGKESIQEAETAAEEAIHALGLRSTTAHVEMLKTEQGWKIIEVGARIGGFRHMLYEFSYGINHAMNDILIRIPETPIISKRVKGHSVAMKFFAKKEGILTKLSGIKKAQELTSFKKIYVNKNIGDQCTFAKHGGSSVFDIILFHEKRSELLADIRRLEQMISIDTE